MQTVIKGYRWASGLRWKPSGLDVMYPPPRVRCWKHGPSVYVKSWARGGGIHLVTGSATLGRDSVSLGSSVLPCDRLLRACNPAVILWVMMGATMDPPPCSKNGMLCGPSPSVKCEQNHTCFHYSTEKQTKAGPLSPCVDTSNIIFLSASKRTVSSSAQWNWKKLGFGNHITQNLNPGSHSW